MFAVRDLRDGVTARGHIRLVELAGGESEIAGCEAGLVLGPSPGYVLEAGAPRRMRGSRARQ